jgi:hypothetical protein
MEDNKNPIAIRWQEQPPPKTIFSLFYKWKALAHDKSLLPSAKGLSFTFMLSLHLLSLCTNYESIVVILSIMCVVSKFIIDWFMIMVLLVLKLFLSSHPLNFEGVLCIYVLLFHEGQAEYHFAMFSLCSKQTSNFQCIIIHDLFLSCVSCCNMVAKFYC